jgi:hypothetical protein
MDDPSSHSSGYGITSEYYIEVLTGELSANLVLSRGDNMISHQITIWRMAIIVMFLLFIVVVILPVLIFVMARFVVDKGDELFST